MIYQVNMRDLAINDILQLIEVIYAEGLWITKVPKSQTLIL